MFLRRAPVLRGRFRHNGIAPTIQSKLLAAVAEVAVLSVDQPVVVVVAEPTPRSRILRSQETPPRIFQSVVAAGLLALAETLGLKQRALCLPKVVPAVVTLRAAVADSLAPWGVQFKQVELAVTSEMVAVAAAVLQEAPKDKVAGAAGAEARALVAAAEVVAMAITPEAVRAVQSVVMAARIGRILVRECMEPLERPEPSAQVAAVATPAVSMGAMVARVKISMQALRGEAEAVVPVDVPLEALLEMPDFTVAAAVEPELIAVAVPVQVPQGSSC